MFCLKTGVVLVCLGLTWAGVAANRTAGQVFVDISAASLTGVTAGRAITTLPNAGTMGDFKAFGAGPTYQLRGSVPVLRFDGTAANCMTNCVKGEVPAALLGNNPWTMEAWIFCEALTGTHTYLSWTARGSAGTVCEFRYTKDGVSNAVEHYGADYNLQWGAALPAVGEWHHVVCVRQANNIERLYLDGKQVWVNSTTLNLGNDGPIMLGGVFERSNYNSPTMLFKGDIACLRIMDGALASGDVYANYVDSYAAFGRVRSDQDAMLVNGAWLDGVQPAAGRGLAVASGETTLTDFRGTLPYLRLMGGKVTFTGATDLVVNNTRRESLFDEYGRAGEFILASGRLDFKNQIQFGLSGPNAPFKMTVGGGDALAVIHGAGETSLGTHNVPGTVSEVQLLRNCVITNETGWVRLGCGIGTTNVLTVAEGALVDAAQLLVGGCGNQTHATVAGTLRSRGNLMGIGEGSSTVLTLEPTGVLAARGFCEWNNKTTWNSATGVSRLHIKGGTLRLDPVASYAETTPFLNTVMLVTYENAMTVDVPLGGTTYIKAAITNVTTSGTSRFVKKGWGTLCFNAPLGGLTGDIYVDEGLVTFKQKFAANADVRIHVAKGACVSCDINGGGASSILSFITTDSEGAVGVHGYDKNENLDLSHHPNLAVCFLNTSEFAGRVTPYGNHYIFEAKGSLEGNYPTAISDVGGLPARVTVRVVPEVADNGIVKLSGDNSGMTGGLTAEEGAKLWLAHPFAAGSSGAVKLCEGTILTLSAAVGSNFMSARVTADSRPDQIFLQAGAEGVNVDLSRFPGCHLGTSGSVTVVQTGTVTPDGNEYIFGGGATPHASSYHGLQPGVLRDRDAETPTTVVVDRDGMVDLSNAANTYSGGTVVTNGARVYIQADGLGAIPETFDAKNLYVNGGVVRTGQASFSVNENRGLWVDEQGAIFHPWGSYTCTYLGGLGGSGAISVTDGGHLTFAGDHNTYTGKITFDNASSILTIGNGAHFSWANGEVATAGKVVLNNNDAETFSGLVSGAGSVEKTGEGTLTVDRAQSFTGVATVNGGTLALTGAGAMASASKIFNKGEITIDRAPSAALGAAPVYGTGVVRVAADGKDLAVDRNVGSAMVLSVKNGATVSYAAPGPNGGATVDVDGATLKVGTTTNGRMGEDFGDFQLNGDAALIASDDVRLTRAVGSVAGSAFWKTRITATRPWEVQFTYEIPNCPATPADGFTFLLQNHANGAKALGGSGGSIGAIGLTPSLGTAFNVYKNNTIGWLYDNAKKDMAAPVSTTFLQVGADVRVAHDGQGRLTTTVFSKGTNVVFRQAKAFDVVARLGGATAYAGFTAATGGSNCEQHIKDFRFTQDDDAPDFALTTNRWQSVGNAVFSTLNGEPAVRLTENKGSVNGVIAQRSRFYLERPFKISGTYVITASSAKAADGVAFVFHDDRLTSIGNLGGSRGFMGSGAGNMPSCAGYSFDVWNSKVDFVKNAAVGSSFTNLNGINLQAKNAPIDFALDYEPGRLVFTARQMVSGTEKIFCATQEVSLADLVGSSFAYFAVTAATGGSTSEQWVYNLKYASGSGSADGYAGGTFTGASALEVTGVAAGNASSSFADVAFADGANVTVRASGAANVPYDVTFETVRFAGGDGTTPTVTVAANGSAAGTILLGTVVADLTGRPLKIVGAVAPKGEKIRIEIPEFKGVYKILDLKGATGVTEEDFELVTATKPPVSLRIVNGCLAAVHSTGTTLFLR